MRLDLERVVTRFPDAVLSGMDGGGWPASVRCRPRYDRAQAVLRCDRAPGVEIVEGRARLRAILDHPVDERSFLVQGELVADGAEWVVTPTRVRAGPGMSGPLGDVAVFGTARRRAGRYLAARGLARPRVPWDRLRS